jgi:tetratricopeptide (TPR) repeat protein
VSEKLQQQAPALIRGASTPAGQLRNLLSQIENNLGKLRISDASELSTLPELYDQAAMLLNELAESGAVIDSEYARFDTVCAEYRKNASQIIKSLGGRNAYMQLREKRQPEKALWWWYLDEYIDDQQRSRQRKLIRSFIIIAGILGVLAVIYVLFLAPDKETREFMNYENIAEQALAKGDTDTALSYVESALAIRPEDKQMLIFGGIAAQSAGNTLLAEKYFNKAKEVIGDEVEFLTSRAQLYLNANMPEYALEDAEKALELNPESAIAYYFKGIAANNLGDPSTAFTALENAAQYARQEGKVELEGMARIQLAYLSQQVSPYQPTATPGE